MAQGYMEPFTKDRIEEAKARFRGSTASMEETLENQQYPAHNEPAMVHPGTNAIMKVRDNGAIDVYAENNIGIRVDPKNKSVNIMAPSENKHVDFIRGFVMKDVTYFIKRDWTINTGKNSTINAKGNVFVNADNNIEMVAKKDFILRAQNIDLWAANHFQFYAGWHYDFD
jgi:hypothetical protein